MRLRHKLLGAGTEDDPFRVPLPTYHLLAADYARGSCLIEVPDDVLPLALARQFNLAANPKLSDPAVQADLAPFHAAWRKHLARRYAENAANYAPEVM